MRQPLSVIESAAFYTALILEPGDPRAIEQLEKIQSTVHRINAMLADLMIHQEAMWASRASACLSQTITDAVTDLRARERVIVDWQAPNVDAVVPLNASLAMQLVRNVVSVFGHLCGSVHPVKVSLRRENGRARLECVTEAVESVIRRAHEIFVPFSPLVPAELGLAMAAVRRIAESNGGFAEMDMIDTRHLRLSVELPACG